MRQNGLKNGLHRILGQFICIYPWMWLSTTPMYHSLGKTWRLLFMHTLLMLHQTANNYLLNIGKSCSSIHVRAHPFIYHPHIASIFVPDKFPSISHFYDTPPSLICDEFAFPTLSIQTYPLQKYFSCDHNVYSYLKRSLEKVLNNDIQETTLHIVVMLLA